ncbi:hypothetical protein PABG_01525 [Paracoccidioides brasiliensis Pb03]|nr:hypothetical protein PABG_01525 [Paracoccidioides brasiliensis Pb03]
MGTTWWPALLLLLNVLVGSVSAVTISGARGGVNPQTGERPVRKDLTKLEWSGPEWDLYILSLKAFQEEDRSELLSFHKIAGIHGYPYVSWDGVEGTNNAGYCSHGSTLFPVWHRPYLAMYEERISRHAQRIANLYPQNVRGKYQQAAQNLRIPYWDWANDPQMPRSVTIPELNINSPSGMRTIPNPLYNYAVRPSAEEYFPIDMLSKYPVTVRTPNDDGESQIESIQRTLISIGAHIRINTYQLLAGETNYTVFSTDSLPNRGGSYNNLENIHGLVHVSVGGSGGHMTYTPWSAYDPIFWLHHTNVDRIVALWQALHPDSYVQPLVNSGTDFIRKAGTMEDSETAFAPFRDPSNQFYNAITSRNTRSFGYTYSEIKDWGVSKQQLTANVRREVNRLYNRASSSDNSKRSPTFSARAVHHHHHHHGVIKHKRMPNLAQDTLDDLMNLNFKLLDFLEDIGKSSLLDFVKLGMNNLKKQWVLNVRANKFAISHAYRIFFFLSEPPKESCDWSYAPNLIGTFASFASSQDSPANMTRDMYGQIPLSHVLALLQSSELISDLDDDTILPLLEKHLQWRVQDLTGKVIDSGEFSRSSVGGSQELQITVAKRDVVPLADDGAERDHFPTLSDWKVFKDITHPAKKVAACKPRYTVKS